MFAALLRLDDWPDVNSVVDRVQKSYFYGEFTYQSVNHFVSVYTSL